MKLSERMRDWDWINRGVNFSHVDGWADEIDQLEAKNALFIGLLAKAVKKLDWLEDEGPIGEGWASDELMALKADIWATLRDEQELSVATNDSPEE